MKNFLTVASFAGLLSFASLGHSQALPTATSRGDIQVGMGWTYAKPDYGIKSLQGITAFGDFDFSPHLGVEAEYHYIALITPEDHAENSFLVGPRFILPRGRVNYYAKAVLGVGDFVIQEVEDNRNVGAGKYFAYAIGVGLDYRITRHVVARGDFEYQHWSYNNGLTPTVLTVGVAYRFR